MPLSGIQQAVVTSWLNDMFIVESEPICDAVAESVVFHFIRFLKGLENKYSHIQLSQMHVKPDLTNS